MILNALIRFGNSAASGVNFFIINSKYSTLSRSLLVSSKDGFPAANNDQLISRSNNELQKMEKPKAPLKPFIRFTMKYRSLFQAKYPDASSTEIMKRLALVWNELGNESRSEYFDSYAKESDEYFESMREYRTHMNAEYQKSLDDKVKRLRKRDENLRKKLLKKYFKAPVKPGNPYLLYSEERKKQENVIPKTREDCLRWMKEMGKAWRLLTDKEKHEYINKYDQAVALYHALTLEWEKEVVEAGYAFLLPDYKRIDFQPTNVHHRRRTRAELIRLETDIDEKRDDPKNLIMGRKHLVK